jgi:hypothetical protein
VDFNKVFLVVCLTILGVIALNAIIYLSLRRGDEANAIDMVRKAARRARDPWKDEDDALEELSRLVTDIRRDISEKQLEEENHQQESES